MSCLPGLIGILPILQRESHACLQPLGLVNGYNHLEGGPRVPATGAGDHFAVFFNRPGGDQRSSDRASLREASAEIRVELLHSEAFSGHSKSFSVVVTHGHTLHIGKVLKGLIEIVTVVAFPNYSNSPSSSLDLSGG